MNSSYYREQRRRVSPGLVVAALGLVLVVVAGVTVWTQRDAFAQPPQLYRSAASAAASAAPERAAQLYGRLGARLPAIAEYAELWAAQAALPDMAAVTELREVIAYRPQSPAAFEAHLSLARYYANGAPPAAEAEYRAALALDDRVELRQELARYLEEQGDGEGAYAEYRHILGKQDDAFEGMRRTGGNPVAVAKDLLAATYASDALDTLREVDDPDAWSVRAQALAAVQEYAEAETAYRKWLEKSPSDVEAQMGLAGVLVALGRGPDALELYRKIDTPDSRLAQADVLARDKPEEALALYRSVPYPLAKWTAAGMLEEQGRLTETLPLYAEAAAGGPIAGAAFADDAAYRLFVLGGRLGDAGARERGLSLLGRWDRDWLALRAKGAEFTFDLAPPLAPAGDEILAKVDALDGLGRRDLAELELTFAARNAVSAEMTFAMSQALMARDKITEAQSTASTYLEEHPYASLAFWQLGYPQPYSDTVRAAAGEFEVDPLLVWSVMRAESLFDPEALSSVGARGLMQVMPETQDWIAEQLGEEIAPGAAFTPETNIRMGAWFLGWLLKYFGGDVELALAAYNGGAGSVDIWQKDPLVKDRDDLLRWIGYGQTREYVERVMMNYQMYRALYGER